VEGAFIGGTISEERYCHTVTLRQLRGEGGTSGDRHAGTHNAVGSEHADTEIGDVHGTALAVTVAVTAAKQLGHHAFQVGPFGDSVAMPTMRADDLVVPAQSGTDSHRYRFLAKVGVYDTRNVPSVKFFHRPVVKGTDGRHQAIHGEELLRLEGHGRLLS
jgi:hypothetical protein